MKSTLAISMRTAVISSILDFGDLICGDAFGLQQTGNGPEPAFPQACCAAGEDRHCP
jgi:hypothetical protein